MRFDIVTIFPGFFEGAFSVGIIRRAVAAGLVQITAHDLRNWAPGRHHIVDDRPFGGGDGMVLKPEPIFQAVGALTGASERESYPRGTKVILLSPQGRVLDQSVASSLAESENLVVICGRYEGVDERVVEKLVTDEISIGDYVLSGGEPAAIVLIDSIVRLVPGALGSETSAANDSFSRGLLDWPHYTRPADFRGMHVPEVLLSGDHAEIERWRRREALLRTERNRPDLLEKFELSPDERAMLVETED